MKEPEESVALVWYGSDSLNEIKDKPLHSIVLLPEEHEEKKFDLGEMIQMWVAEPNQRIYWGRGEVIALKRCRVRHLETKDLERLMVEERTVGGVVNTLNNMHPQREPRINASSEVVVVTLFRNSYDLGSLNAYVKPRIKSKGVTNRNNR